MEPRVHHFGITVSDLDVSTAFYARFGAREVGAGHFHGPEVSRTLGVKRADLTVRLLAIGPHVLELLHYADSDGRAYTSRNNDIGAPHLALEVEDIHKMYDQLVADGFEAYSPPFAQTEPEFAGGFFVYIKDPDGITVELLQTPGEASRASDTTPPSI